MVKVNSFREILMLAGISRTTWSFIKSHKILGAILLLYGSTIFVALFGKMLRVRDYQMYGLSTVEYLDFFRPELFGGLGLIFLILTITTVNSRLLVPFIISYALWAVVSLFEILGALYFTATSDTNLDISIMLYSFANLDELMPVFINANAVMRTAATVIPIMILMVLLLSIYLKSKGEKKCPWMVANRWAFASLPVLTVVCMLISILPNRTFDDRGHTQTFTYYILSSIEDIGEASSLVDESDAVSRFPIVTSIAKTENSPTRNFVAVVLESTRLSATTVGNPELKTTPFLLNLAGQSELYTNVYTIVPHTSKALQGILCGIEPSTSHWVTEGSEKGLPTDCLAKMLAHDGYKTAFFQTAKQKFENRGGLVSNMGYAEFFPLESVRNPGSYETVNYFGIEDEAMLPMSEEWLSQVGQEPFFATYLTLTPHHNYNAPDRYGRFEFPQDEKLTASQNSIRNDYLNTIYYQDHFIRQLIEQYKALGLYENTIFMFVGDHGEAFGEHGRLQHDTVLYNEGIQVPLIIHDPQNTSPKVLSEIMSTLDILPTILGKLGYQLEREDQRGYKYGERNDAPVMSHCARVKSCMSIIKDGYKMIHHFGIKGDELFSLSDDTDETNNLADDHQDLTKELLAEMNAWRADLLIQYRLFFIGD
jgi:lipoteichoic acid synthase